MSVIKFNCPICRGTKRVDKVGGLHSKECPNCKGLGKVEKNAVEDIIQVTLLEADKFESEVKAEEAKMYAAKPEDRVMGSIDKEKVKALEADLDSIEADIKSLKDNTKPKDGSGKNVNKLEAGNKKAIRP